MTLVVDGRDDVSDISLPSPPLITCALGKSEMTRKLLRSDFSLSQADADGRTAFHYAAAFDNIAILKILWEDHYVKYRSIFRAKDKLGLNAVQLRERVYKGIVDLAFSIDLVAKLRDGGAIVDKLALEEKKNKTIRFLIETCNFPEADSSSSKLFGDCGGQNTLTKETPSSQASPPNPVSFSEDFESACRVK